MPPTTATHFELHVKDKGRTVLPVALRDACGFETGVTLIARQIGPGQAIVETENSILERMWSRNVEDGTDGVEALRAMRAADNELLTTRAQDTGEGDDDSDARGAALLEALGLD